MVFAILSFFVSLIIAIFLLFVGFAILGFFIKHWVRILSIIAIGIAFLILSADSSSRKTPSHKTTTSVRK